MKKNRIIILISTALALSFSCMNTAAPLVIKDSYKTLNAEQIGEIHSSGITYEYWKQGGSGQMYLRENGTFAVNWYKHGLLPNNLLARTGLRPGSNVKGISYSVDYNPKGVSFMCVYGWNQSDTLIEYYIVDNWHSDWRPPGNTSDYKGTVTIDGARYDIYTSLRKNKPSIKGNTTFVQYWSVRQEPRSEGLIDVKKHFNAWAGTDGMIQLNDLYEVSFCIEGVNSSGYADVQELEFILADTFE